MVNRVIILAFWFCAILACSTQKNSLEGVYISIDSNAVHSDSLMLYKDKSFKLNYNGYGHPLPDVIFGNWVQCGNRLHLIPENFVRKIIEKKDTNLVDSVSIKVYDYEMNQCRVGVIFNSYSNGEVIKLDPVLNHKNDYSYIFYYNACDSIEVVADDFLNSEYTYRPMIIPKPNTRYTVYARFTGTGFFLERNFYIKKGGKQIYVKWDKDLYEKWKKEKDIKTRKGYFWLEKVKKQ